MGMPLKTNFFSAILQEIYVKLKYSIFQFRISFNNVFLFLGLCTWSHPANLPSDGIKQ